MKALITNSHATTEQRSRHGLAILAALIMVLALSLRLATMLYLHAPAKAIAPPISVNTYAPSRKCAAACNPIGVGQQRLILILVQVEPVQALLVDLPNQIFLHAIALIHALFVVEIIGGAAGRDLHDQLGCAFNVIVCGDTRAPACSRL